MSRGARLARFVRRMWCGNGGIVASFSDYLDARCVDIETQ